MRLQKSSCIHACEGVLRVEQDERLHPIASLKSELEREPLPLAVAHEMRRPEAKRVHAFFALMARLPDVGDVRSGGESIGCPLGRSSKAVDYRQFVLKD